VAALAGSDDRVALGALQKLRFHYSSVIAKRQRRLGYQGDIGVNSLGDILCCVLGFMIARRLGLRRSVLAFLVTEIVLLLWIGIVCCWNPHAGPSIGALKDWKCVARISIFQLPVEQNILNLKTHA